MHGGMKSSQHFTKLATMLSDAFTVYVPDRRGRGLSGPHGNNFSIMREVEDLQALITKTGARLTFGLSSGGAGGIAHGPGYTVAAENGAVRAAVFSPRLGAHGLGAAQGSGVL
jgi:pimeloyl-ACP methyl ester carboxylesterase